MLQLSTKVNTRGKDFAEAANLTSKFPQEDLDAIGTWVMEGYERDKESRTSWARRNQAGMDLALQLQKDKSFPWPGAANVAFPLVTIAAMQFHSRAYPTLINGIDIVKCRVPGPDAHGEATSRAITVGQYMSYQVLEEDQAWEEQHDRAFLQLPIIGCVFIKTRYDAGRQHNVSELVPAVSLVMNYYAKSVESCSRKTHIIPFYRNDVYEKCATKVWKDIRDEAWYADPQPPVITTESQRQDARTGTTPPSSPDDASPLTFLEQHCFMDLDQDGYAEPYTVLVEESSRTVVRITARWDREEDVEREPTGKVIRITATESFTKLELIPSPDGSVYGLGFGVLLGPLNESVNTILNQLIDAGTMANAAGGFLSRGVKIRGGAYNFKPFGWNPVDSTGDDLKKGILPLPVREPSDVLFKLLSFLVDYTERVGGSTDATQGQNPGQNTPAQTQQSMVEQGMKIYSALFKRAWRGLKEEFRKLYILNAKHLPEQKFFGMTGKVGREMFLGDPSQVVPAADPNITSDFMRLQQAMAVAQRAPAGGYDRDAVERNLLQAMRVDNIDSLYPGLEKMPPTPNPKIAAVQMQTQSKEKIEQGKQQFQMQTFIAEMQQEQQLNQAKIIQLMAQADLFAAQAENAEANQQVEMINAMIGMARAHNDALQRNIELALQHAQTQIQAHQAETQRIATTQPQEPASANA